MFYSHTQLDKQTPTHATWKTKCIFWAVGCCPSSLPAILKRLMNLQVVLLKRPFNIFQQTQCESQMWLKSHPQISFRTPELTPGKWEHGSVNFHWYEIHPSLCSETHFCFVLGGADTKKTREKSSCMSVLMNSPLIFHFTLTISWCLMSKMIL